VPDYEAMYFRLFNKISDAIRLLQEAQQQTEEAYLESGYECGEETRAC